VEVGSPAHDRLNRKGTSSSTSEADNSLIATGPDRRAHPLGPFEAGTSAVARPRQEAGRRVVLCFADPDPGSAGASLGCDVNALFGCPWLVVGLDGLHGDMGVDRGQAGGVHQLAGQKGFVGREVGDGDTNEVVGVTEHAPELDNLIELGDA